MGGAPSFNFECRLPYAVPTAHVCSRMHRPTSVRMFKLRNNGQENKIVQPKTDKWFSFSVHFFTVSDHLAVV